MNYYPWLCFCMEKLRGNVCTRVCRGEFVGNVREDRVDCERLTTTPNVSRSVPTKSAYLFVEEHGMRVWITSPLDILRI